MMADVSKLYSLLEPLASQPECNTCRLCEENVGLVYALGQESARVAAAGGKLSVTSKGVQYLARTREGWCSCFDPEMNRCRIYLNRPLCCRIYPLDLMRREGDLWWVIHSECPIAQRFQREHRLDILCVLTVRLERSLTQEELEVWKVQDETSQIVEAFSFEEAKVVPLRRLGEPMIFP